MGVVSVRVTGEEKIGVVVGDPVHGFPLTCPESLSSDDSCRTERKVVLETRVVEVRPF